MDFHAMKRKRLQSLCKKHGIPANLKNKDMANRLSLIFKGKDSDLSSCSGSDSAGIDEGTFQCVSGKDLLTENAEESGELNNNSDNDQQVASDIVARSADVMEEKLLNSGKRNASPNLEERIGFSPKLLKSSEIQRLEFETNLYPEIKRDVDIRDVEENMQNGGNKEPVDDSQEGLHSATGEVDMKDVYHVQVAMEEFGDRLEEDEVEKLVENIDVHDCVGGTGNAEDEVEKQDDTNSPQVSIIKSLSPLVISPGEHGYSLVEEVHKSKDGIFVHEKEQVDDSQEALLTAPSVLVTSEELGNSLVEREVDKLRDITDAEEDIDGARKVGAEAENQVGTDSHQGPEPDINDVNPLHDSPEESDYPLEKGEVKKSDDGLHIGSEVDTMSFVDTSIGSKDSDGKTAVTMEHFPDGVHSCSLKYSYRKPDQLLNTNSPSEAMSSDLTIHQMVVSGTAAGNVDAREAKFVSSSNTSPDSEKTIGFSPDLLNDLVNKGLEFESNLSPETPKDDIESFDVEENMQTGDNKGLEFETNFPLTTPTDDIEICDVAEKMQSGVNKDHINDSKEVMHGASTVVAMNNVDLVQVSSEEFGNYLAEREFEKLVDKTDLNEDVRGAGKGGAEVEPDDTDSPQGSNINDVNKEESGCPLVEGEIQKFNDISCAHESVYNFKSCETEVDFMCFLDTSTTSQDSDGKTNVTAEHFPDQVHSSNFEDSDGIPDQFLATYPPSEVKSSDFNIHEMVASDTTEEKLESPQKKGQVADPEECIEFYSKHHEASEIKGFEADTNFDPSTLGDIVETCNMKESKQSVKIDNVSEDDGMRKEKLGSSSKCTPVANSEKRNNYFHKVLETTMMKKELKKEKNSTLKTARNILGICDMKENINTAKKEQYGSTMKKQTFPKRQPLQDLQQK